MWKTCFAEQRTLYYHKKPSVQSVIFSDSMIYLEWTIFCWSFHQNLDRKKIFAKFTKTGFTDRIMKM